MGGGYVDTVGGMIVFAANDLSKAKKVADGDFLIQRELYTYELKEWEHAIVSAN